MKYFFQTFIIALFIAYGPASSFGQQIQKEGQFLGFKIIDGSNSVVIPFEIHNNLIVIPVVVNGTIPLKFILDTGVRTAILMDKGYADILGLKYSRTITLFGAGGGNGVAAHVAPNVSLSLPGIMGVGQSLLVMDEDYLHLGGSLGIEVHGIMGYEIFSRFVVEINYVQNVLTLYEPGTLKKQRNLRRFVEVPLSIEDTKPYVTSNINITGHQKIHTKLLIDTGASHSLLLHLDSHEDIDLPQKTISTSIGRSLAGDIDGKVGRIAELNFSGFKIPNIVTSFPDENSFSEIIAITERNGSIGGAILNRFDVIFDYVNKKLLIKKNSDFKRKSNFNMSGIDLRAEGQNYKKMKIAKILPDSPADLHGLEVGDEIVMANGASKENLTLTYLNNLFKSRANKKIKLRIYRRGEFLKKSFRLKKMI